MPAPSFGGIDARSKFYPGDRSLNQVVGVERETM